VKHIPVSGAQISLDGVCVLVVLVTQLVKRTLLPFSAIVTLTDVKDYVSCSIS